MSSDIVTTESAVRAAPGPADRLMVGAIDLHCHSGLSVMPRYFDHYEAMQEASSAGIRTLLIKDHYHSAKQAGTVDRTVLGSDLGQESNPRPVDGFRSVIETCLALGHAEEDIRKMTSTNSAQRVGS